MNACEPTRRAEFPAEDDATLLGRPEGAWAPALAALVLLLVLGGAWLP